MNYLASIGINILIVILYYNFLFMRDGISGLAVIYTLAIITSGLVYIFRKKTLKVDWILAGILMFGVIYALLYKKSWYLLSEIIMTQMIVLSLTYYYFDWSGSEEEKWRVKAMKAKKETNENNQPN